MKEEAKVRKEAYAKKQEQKGKKIIYAIFIALCLGAIGFLAWASWLVS